MAIDPTIVRDVVIVIPGIMGSELVDARGRRVWSVSAGALARAIRTLGGSLRELELPDGIGDDRPDDGVRATGLVKSLHVVPGLWSPVTGYDGLLDFLRSERFHLVEAVPGRADQPPNVIEFPYDWRLSNRYNGRLLARIATDALERWRSQPGMDEAKLILVCHSMGGLVARWFAEQEGGAALIRSLITMGTPYRGALKALGTLVNGIDPSIGPLHLRLTNFARSLPSLYQLLPQYDCVATSAGRTNLVVAGAPGLNTAMLHDAMAFHNAIAGEGELGYKLHKVVGIRQPTPTTARIVANRVRASSKIDGRDQGGDGTVPRLAAEPVSGRGQEVHEVAGQHGELQGSRSLLDLLDGIISRVDVIWQDVEADPFGVDMADVWSTRDDPLLQVTNLNDRRLWVTIRDEAGRQVGGRILVSPQGTAQLGRLTEGGYRAVVGSDQPGGPAPVAKPFLVFDPEAPLGG